MRNRVETKHKKLYRLRKLVSSSKQSFLSRRETIRKNEITMNKSYYLILNLIDELIEELDKE